MAATHLARSASEVAMAVLHAELPVSALDVARRRLPELSLMSCVGFGFAQALREHPDLNAHYKDGRLFHAAEVNLGIAVATDGGDLLVPVAHDATAGSITDFAARMRDLVERARKRRLRPDDMQGASATLSALNTSQWLRQAVPVVPQPQVAILVALRPVERFIPGPGGSPVIEKMMPVTLGFDHRAVNGVPAANMINTLAAIFADPARLGLHQEGH